MSEQRETSGERPAEPISRAAMATLAARVYGLVRACPSGRVTTYGGLAKAVGLPASGGARLIGWVMNEAPRWANVPTQRVINSKGELTGSWAFGQKGKMRSLLEAEGVVFNETGRVDMKRFGWDPARDLDEAAREAIFAAVADEQVEVSDTLMRLTYDDPASPFRVQPRTGDA